MQPVLALGSVPTASFWALVVILGLMCRIPGSNATRRWNWTLGAGILLCVFAIFVQPSAAAFNVTLNGVTRSIPAVQLWYDGYWTKVRDKKGVSQNRRTVEVSLQQLRPGCMTLTFFRLDSCFLLGRLGQWLHENLAFHQWYRPGAHCSPQIRFCRAPRHRAHLARARVLETARCHRCGQH